MLDSDSQLWIPVDYLLAFLVFGIVFASWGEVREHPKHFQTCCVHWDPWLKISRLHTAQRFFSPGSTRERIRYE